MVRRLYALYCWMGHLNAMIWPLLIRGGMLVVGSALIGFLVLVTINGVMALLFLLML